MDNYHVYLLQLKEIGLQIYRNEFFEELTVVLTICLFFLLGRLSYDKKLTHLLEMVNDAETTRKKLVLQLQNESNMVDKIKKKKKVVWGVLVLTIIGNAVLYYLNNRIVVIYTLYSLIPLVAISLLYLAGQTWSEWKKKKTEKRLKSTSHSAEAEMKEILKIFGEGLKERLKMLYSSEIDAQWNKQLKEECKLYKCYNEKKCYESLYKLYDEIIDEIKKTNMCDVCLNQNNVTVQKLGLPEFENSIKAFKRAKASKLTLLQKKEMVNKLLFEYQKMIEKLPNICKKGCCIKQRVLIENAKVKYLENIKRVTAQLVSNEKKS